MYKEILISLGTNFVFSLCLFAYKQRYHRRYDEIIRRMEKIERLLMLNNIVQHQDKIGIFKDEKLENIEWVTKEYFNKNM